MTKNISVLILFFATTSLMAQNSNVDSLKVIAEGLSDSAKTQIYLDIANAYRTIRADSALNFSRKALAIAESNQNFYNQADAYMILGSIYRVMGDYERATASLLQALKYYELIGDQKGVANTSNSIGILYFSQDDYEKALKYYKNALSLVDSASYPSSSATYILNIGEINALIGKLSEAEIQIDQSLQIFESIGDLEGMAYCYGVLAKINYQRNELKEASNNINQALEFFMQIQDYVGAMEYLLLLADVQTELKKNLTAINNTKLVVSIAKQVNSEVFLQKAYDKLSDLYAKLNQLDLAYAYKDSSFNLRESLFDDERVRQIENLRIAYETEQKEQENKLLKENRGLNERKIRQQEITNYAIGIILLLIFIVLILVVRAYRIKQRSNRKLRRYNEEISQQREEIETQAEKLKDVNERLVSQSDELSLKNKNITDSITYAERIQSALLPFDNRIKNVLPDHFIIYRPKDIVSGDFYWFKEVDEKVFIVVADCTGHGIPGAFMSFIGHDILNYLINLRSIFEPQKILDEMKKNVIHLLRQKENDNRDGLDVGVCVWNKKTKKLSFAGANIDLFYIKNKESHIIKGDKISISFDELKRNRHFNQHEITIDVDTCFYMSTDGFADQFGGPEDRKFMKKSFRDLIFDHHLKKMSSQKEVLVSAFEKWKQDREQVDDVLVFGFRLYE